MIFIIIINHSSCEFFFSKKTTGCLSTEVMLMVGVLRGLNKNGIWAGPPAVAFCSLLVLYWARPGDLGHF